MAKKTPQFDFSHCHYCGLNNWLVWRTTDVSKGKRRTRVCQTDGCKGAVKTLEQAEAEQYER